MNQDHASGTPKRRWKLRASVVALAFAATMSSPVASASPALPAVYLDGLCQPGEFCLYYSSGFGQYIYDVPGCRNNAKYSGWQYVTMESPTTRGGQPTNISLENSVSSVWNRSTCHYALYENESYQGYGLYVARGTKIDIARDPAMNDKASSHSSRWY
jgi:hypothetical protein